MNNPHESRKSVEAFLSELKEVLSAKSFDIEKQLRIYPRPKNVETMVALNFSPLDVADCLLRLKVSNYYETIYDVIGKDDPKLLRVFGIDIKRQQIYIKLKITEKNRKVVCVSFHKAEDPMIFPYA